MNGQAKTDDYGSMDDDELLSGAVDALLRGRGQRDGICERLRRFVAGYAIDAAHIAIREEEVGSRLAALERWANGNEGDRRDPVGAALDSDDGRRLVALVANGDSCPEPVARQLARHRLEHVTGYISRLYKDSDQCRLLLSMAAKLVAP